MKRRWQEKRDAEGKDKAKPNIIMGSNAQVALEKFARYFEVEARILDVSEKSKYRLDPELVKKNIDENTIGVFVSKSSQPSHHSPFHHVLGPGELLHLLGHVLRPSNHPKREYLTRNHSVMGSTYTGHYEPVEEISKLLDEYEEKTGNDIPIHVDAASGGFIAPFTYAHAGGPKW